MTRKTRFASSGIILLSLTASLFSLTAQAQVLESSLGNLGRAVDNLLPLELEPTTTLLGQGLDNSVLEYVDFEVTFEVLHNQLHSWLKPGQVLSPTLQLAHESLDSLGDTVAATDLPLQAGQAASGLLHGVGDTVLSTGGLLYDVPNEPNPLTSILGHATNGIAAATDALLQGNTLLSPLPTLSPDSAPRTSLNTGTTDGLLAPVTNVLVGLNGNGDTSNGGLLAPVTGLLGGLLAPPR